MKTARTELADALRLLNAEYRRLPDPDRLDLFTDELAWLETVIGREMAAGDDRAARIAIRDWRDRHLERFKKHREANRG